MRMEWIPGVLKIGHRNAKQRRTYVSLRIPECLIEVQHSLYSLEAL